MLKGMSEHNAWWGLAKVLFLLIFVVFLWRNFEANFVSNGRHQPAYLCINNLRQFDAAANELALEEHLTNGTPIHFPDDLKPWLRTNALLCPSKGIYHLKRIGDNPTCSLGSTVTPAHVLP